MLIFTIKNKYPSMFALIINMLYLLEMKINKNIISLSIKYGKTKSTYEYEDDEMTL